MATDFIAVDTKNSYDSEPATESIKVGEPIVRLSGGGARRLDPSSDTDVKYIVGYKQEADHNARYEFEYTSYDDLYTYEPASNKSDEDFDDLVEGIIPLSEHDVVRSYSIEDTSMTEPTFTENDTVGFIAAPNGPRLVPEGYTDDFSGTSTTYNEANGNFVTLGSVDELPEHKTQKTGYNELIPVRVE